VALVEGPKVEKVVKYFSNWKVTSVFADKQLDVAQDIFFTRILARVLNSHLQMAHTNEKEEV
jgi:hypothetical protein